ncbi:MAG: hypothetical protein V3W19_14950 [Desulfatiglandales bacterium]
MNEGSDPKGAGIGLTQEGDEIAEHVSPFVGPVTVPARGSQCGFSPLG